MNNFRGVQCESWELYLTGACADNVFAFMGYLFDFRWEIDPKRKATCATNLYLRLLFAV
jgi:hypothetical protein